MRKGLDGMDNNRGKRQSASIFGGMGFYIALLVCVLAAGVVGYFALLRDDAALEEDDLAAVDQMEDGGAQEVSVPDEEPAQPVISREPVVVSRPEPEETQETEEEPAEAPAAESSAPVMDIPDTAPVIAQEPTHRVVSPLAGEVAAAFSVEELTYDETLGDWRTHDGVDILADAGTPVAAASAGTVLTVEEDGLLGVTVTVDHGDGYVTTYASLQAEPEVMAGDAVSAGDIIGAVGNTSLTEAGLGAHLHFSVAKDGELVDPQAYLAE